jgi:DNA-binding transcriptional LysR family regulator
MVAAGVGIGMVPRSAAVEGVTMVEIADDWAPRDLQLCFRAKETLSPAAMALIACLAGRQPG